MTKLERYPEYKDSGVEWLGEVPAHWQMSKISWISPFTVGWTPPTGNADSFEGDNRWANISDLGPRVLADTAKRISDEAVRAARIPLVAAGSLLFSFKLSVGQVSFAGTEMYTNEAIASFGPSPGIDLRWAYYAYPLFIVENSSQNIYGAKILNQERIRGTRLPLPPVEEQQAIADYLDRETAEIDAFIADQERLIELLRERLQNTVNLCIGRGLDPAREMVRTRVPWIAEAPLGWTVMKLARLGIHQESGTSVNGTGVSASDGEIGVLKTGAVSKGYFDSTENKTVVDDDLERVSCPVREGTLIVNRANTPDLVGRAGYVEGARTGLYLSDKLWQLDFKEADNEFIYWWTKSDVYTTQLQFHRVGASSSMQNLSFQDFVSLDIAVPPTDEQLQIAAHLRAEGARIQAAIREAGEAIELSRERRSALISGAVSGTFRTL